MGIRTVRMLGDSLLRETSEVVTAFDDTLFQVIMDVTDTLVHLQKEKGIVQALAAPQVGHFKRIVAVNLPDRRLLLVNPVIFERSPEMVDVWDSCFSFDVAFFVRVQRHATIRVRWQDALGQTQEETFEGSHSELLQHEIDHLNGVLPIDRLECGKTTDRPWAAESIIMRSEWEKRFR
jgi:peptide deformylase